MFERAPLIVPRFRASVTRGSLVSALALGLIALLLAALIVRDVFIPAAPAAARLRTAQVTRGSIRSTVTSTGSVVPASQLNLNFRAGGTLAEVDVKVGDQVKAGQVVAKLDTRSLGIALDQARASLQSAQANLTAALDPVTPEQVAQLRHSLGAAQNAYNDTVNSVNTTNQQDAAAVSADQQQLKTDQQQLQNDQGASGGQLQFDQQQLAADQGQVSADQATYQADGCLSNPQPNPAKCATDQAKLTADQAKVAGDQQRISADQAAVTADQKAVSADQSKLATDQSKAQQDTVSGQAKLSQATAAITSARDALTVGTQAKPNSVATAQASVASAEAQLATAQLNFDQATLTAPVDATVVTLTGAVGESVGSGSGATSQAPGSNAPQPSSSTGATGSTGSAASGFIVLSQTSGYQAVVAFAETDAARLKAGQAAAITFDAIGGLSIPAQVVAISVNSTVVSNVVNYYVTLSLAGGDPRLKLGMTANAVVTVESADNALTVPNSAVTRVRQAAFVTVLRDGKQVRTPVQTGVSDDRNTQITSGLQQGETVVLPQARVSTPQQGGNRGGGGGGLGVGG